MIQSNLRRALSYAPVALAVWACGVASAADGEARPTSAAVTSGVQPGEQVDAPPKPPQAAFDACKSLVEGEACSVSFNGHTMNGTCRKGPNGEAELACVPARPPSPPPEAIEACKGAAEGASCSMTMPDGQSLSGTCRKGARDSDVLACAPPHPSGPPPSGNRTATLSESALEHRLDQLEREIHSN